LTKTKRHVELIKRLAKEPWQHDKKSLAHILETSESTIQRDLEELKGKDYRFIQNEQSRYFLVQGGWLGQHSLKDSTLRQMEILRLLYRLKRKLTLKDILRRVTSESEEDLADKTIERAVKDLLSKGLVTREGNFYMLNHAQVLPPLELSEHERRVFYDALKLAKALNPLPEQMPVLEAKLKLKLPLEEPRETIYIHGRTPTRDIRRNQYCNRLEQAAQECIVLTILYRKEDSPAKEYRLKPLGIVYYWILDKWYLVAEHQARVRSFAIDQILHVEWENEHFTPLEGFNLKEYFKYSWGMYHCEQRTPVKIRFYDTHSTLQRVKEELMFRETCTMLEDEKGIIMVDEVEGIQELAVWLRGLGSGAEVLSPKILRELVRTEWLDMAKLYQD
jgi:predicted DNA-binding transcriptional regulator YafY